MMRRALAARAVPTLYPLVAAGSVVAFGCTLWASERYAPWFAAPAAALGAAAAIGSFAFELRRDPVTAARVALAPSLWIAIVGGAAFALDLDPRGPPSIVIPVLAALPALAVLVLIVRMQWGREDLRNFLREPFGARAGEERGVQLGVASPEALRTGELGWLEAHLQNTWDAPRTVVLSVGGTGAWGARHPDRTGEIVLEALEVAVVRIPLVVDESEVPNVRLAVELSVRGGGGRRRRLWRAARPAHRRRLRPHPEAQFGRPGGIVVDVPVTGPAVTGAALPDLEVRRVWQRPPHVRTLVRGA